METAEWENRALGSHGVSEGGVVRGCHGRQFSRPAYL